MTEIKPTGPSLPKESKPEDLQAKKPSKAPPPAHGETDEKYLGFTFNSPKAYEIFKSKFLVRLANEMIRQIKHETERMVKALRKMREDQ